MSTDDGSPSPALTADEVKSYILRTDATAPCSVADIHSIPEAIKDLDVYWLGSVPCRNVQLVGILIEATEYEARSIYLIDDGTASINCLRKRPVRMSAEEIGLHSFHRSRGFELGDTISVVGKIESYKSVRQLYVSSIEKCTSPDAESQHILHVLRQHRNVYSQPFTIPPLPPPSTPKKKERANSQPQYPSSIASSPTTAICSSPVVSPKKDKPRLRHPSRLRSKDLNENVFRMYLSHIIISTLSMPESTSQDYVPLELPLENGGTPRPSRTKTDSGLSDCTPTRPSRPPVDSLGSPTPKKSVGSLPAERPAIILGVTLSYLRRVQVLSDLARRVVDHAAHERDKAMRHAERNARAKYEALHPPTSERVTSSAGASSESRASKTSAPAGSRSKSAQVSHKSSSRKGAGGLSNVGGESLPPQSSSTSRSSVSSSARSSNKSRSSSRNNLPSTLTPEETARRAAYHAKLAKLHEEDKRKRPARMKRLFESALRTLVKEGELTLFDGPRRQIHILDGPTGGIPLTPSGIWYDATNTTTSSTISAASTALSAPSCSDLETISEDDNQAMEILSDPSDSEDAYVPVTPEVLRPVMLAALRQSLLVQRGGVDLKSWAKALRSDGQWAQIPDLVVKETIETLRQEEWITRVGAERWDFTRGSWARSLKLS